MNPRPRCTNPLEERRATKKKGEKDELTSEETCLAVLTVRC